MSNAFAPIVRARPCPIFGRPVHRRGRPLDYSPILLLRLFGFRIAPDTLSSAGLSKASATAPIASGWSVSPVGACTHLYEGLACQDVFSRSTFLLFVSFQGEFARAQFCVDGMAAP